MSRRRTHEEYLLELTGLFGDVFILHTEYETTTNYIISDNRKVA